MPHSPLLISVALLDSQLGHDAVGRRCHGGRRSSDVPATILDRARQLRHHLARHWWCAVHPRATVHHQRVSPARHRPIAIAIAMVSRFQTRSSRTHKVSRPPRTIRSGARWHTYEMKPAPPDDRNTAAIAISCLVPSRPSGISVAIMASTVLASTPGASLVKPAVSAMGPGAMPTLRIPYAPHSSANERVTLSIAALAAAA